MAQHLQWNSGHREQMQKTEMTIQWQQDVCTFIQRAYDKAIVLNLHASVGGLYTCSEHLSVFPDLTSKPQFRKG